jgi:APA family basic amino acid/polyamine antiporter
MIMISTFACNNGLIMTGARVYYTMAQDGIFKKAAELNKFSVPEWSIQHSVFGLRFYVLRGNMIYCFVVIIVLIFYILTILGIFILRKNDAERPYRAFGYPFYLHLILLLLYLVLLCYNKTSTSGWVS